LHRKTWQLLPSYYLQIKLFILMHVLEFCQTNAIASAIKKKNEIQKGVITLTKEANAKYVLRRLHELGWRVVEARRQA